MVRRTLHLALPVYAAGLLGACAERVNLQDADGEIRLTYTCVNPVLHASNPGERRLVREYAIRIVKHANARGTLATLEPLMRAYDAQDDAALERAVVQYLCEHGAVPEEKRRQERRTAIFPEAGTQAPEFALPRLAAPEEENEAGQIVRLSDHRGQFVLLDFWATWCAPCRWKYPEMVELAEEFRMQGLVVYGILHKDSPSRAQRWFAENGGMGYPFLVGNVEITRAYGITGIPRQFLIGPDGKVVGSCYGCAWGPWSPQDLRQRLPALLP